MDVGLLVFLVVEPADEVVDDEVGGVAVGAQATGGAAAAAEVWEDEVVTWRQADQRFAEVGVVPAWPPWITSRVRSLGPGDWATNNSTSADTRM